MKIDGIRVHQFAGLRNVTIAFDRGLNVIIGRNESGKSTLFSAMQKALFTPAKIGKREMDKDFIRWIPIGGDTASVELDFSVEDKRYTVCKSWGAAVNASLKQPDGSVLNNEEIVQETVRSLLPASIGTLKSTLMTYQMGLQNTILDITSEYPETVSEIGDVLRKAFMNSDGVSIDVVRQRLDDLSTEYLNLWDIQNNQPKKGKTVSGRWVKGVRLVLQAYYDWETAAGDLEKITVFENDYDVINGEISGAEGTCGRLEEYLAANRKIVADIGERKVILAEQRSFEMEVEAMKAANSAWPVAEHKIKELTAAIPGVEGAIAVLQTEFDLAKQAEANRSKAEKFIQLKSTKGELDEKEAAFKRVKVLTREELKKLRDLERQTALSGSRTSAGELRMTIIGKRETSVTIQKDVDDRVVETIAAGMEKKIDAAGAIRVSHEDFDILVTSDQAGILETLAASKLSQGQFEEALRTLGVDTLDAAEIVNDTYETAKAIYERINGQFIKELGERRYADLEDEFTTISAIPAARSSMDVFVQLRLKQDHLKDMLFEISVNRGKVEEYATKYISSDDLLIQLGSKSLALKEIAVKLTKLSDLPPDAAGDTEAYLAGYVKKETDLVTLKERLAALKIDRATLLGGAPNTSAEDKETEVHKLKREFDSLLETAKAIERVRTVFEEVVEEVGGNTYGDLEKKLTANIEALTMGRYTRVTMDQALPGAFITNGSLAIPGEYLSSGTKDIMGIAVRLTMARYFLGESEGFLVLDDPFVNLDAERKQQAALLLKAFAREKQVIVFTCHEDHAALLAGTTTRLN